VPNFVALQQPPYGTFHCCFVHGPRGGTVAAMPKPAFYVRSGLRGGQAQTAPTVLETPIWKTITVGGFKGVNAIRKAIEAAPCRILVGEMRMKF
jgi:hypothetical protein